jgi:hypothetical protein
MAEFIDTSGLNPCSRASSAKVSQINSTLGQNYDLKAAKTKAIRSFQANGLTVLLASAAPSARGADRTDRGGLAIEGHDPGAFFTDGMLRHGGRPCAWDAWKCARNRAIPPGRRAVAAAIRSPSRAGLPEPHSGSMVIVGNRLFLFYDYLQRAEFLAQSMRSSPSPTAMARRGGDAHAPTRGAFIAPAAMKPGIRKSAVP